MSNRPSTLPRATYGGGDGADKSAPRPQLSKPALIVRMKPPNPTKALHVGDRNSPRESRGSIVLFGTPRMARKSKME